MNEKIAQSGFFRRQLFRVCYKIKVKRLEEGLASPQLNKFDSYFCFWFSSKKRFVFFPLSD